MKKTYLFYVTIFLFISMSIFTQDMDFGIFNYKGSRLKKVKRYLENKCRLDQEIEYFYDKDGYLIARNLTMPVFPNKTQIIYKSKIDYDLENNIITEAFDKHLYKTWEEINHQMTYLIYYYDEQKRLIRLKRKNDDELSKDLIFKYNNKGDFILIADKTKISNADYVFFPGNGIAYDRKSIFKYEYSKDKKIRYCYLNRYDKYSIRQEFFYKNKRLFKMHEYPVYYEYISSINIFKYNKMGNIIETKFENPEEKSTKKIIYKYDDKNRLTKRILHYPNNIANGMVKEIEEFYYEDGNYVYYPYLLPPKIKIYYIQRYESLIDKMVY